MQNNSIVSSAIWLCSMVSYIKEERRLRVFENKIINKQTD